VLLDVDFRFWHDRGLRGRGFHVPLGSPSLVAGVGMRCSWGLRERADAGPGRGDGIGPAPGGGDLQLAARASTLGSEPAAVSGIAVALRWRFSHTGRSPDAAA